LYEFILFLPYRNFEDHDLIAGINHGHITVKYIIYRSNDIFERYWKEPGIILEFSE